MIDGVGGAAGMVIGGRLGDWKPLESVAALSLAYAAFYVGLSRRTLEKMRRQGRGPLFRKHGRYVRYHITDLIAWSQSSGRTTTDQPTDAGSGDE